MQLNDNAHYTHCQRQLRHNPANDVFYITTDTDFENRIWETENRKINVSRIILNWEGEQAPVEYNFSKDSNYLEKIKPLLISIYGNETANISYEDIEDLPPEQNALF